MVKVHFMTPVGEFIAVFADKDSADVAVNTEYRFTGINGETLIIPPVIQNNSVILIVEE